jgi:hypothetical protein
MDATCKFCGNPAEVGAIEDGESTCGPCSKRAQRRRLIFDVGGGRETSRRDTPTPLEQALEALPSSPPEETRMLDLRDLARRTRQALETVPEIDEGDFPISVREAILMADSIAPASIEPARTEAAPPPPADPPPSSPDSTTRRLNALYSGVGLLLVMAALVVAKARMGREVASAAPLTPEQSEPITLLSATSQAPSADALPAAVTPGATTRATAAPITTTSAPRKAPPRPAPPPPKKPAPADTTEVRAATEPTVAPKVVLLDAMAAAVAAHSSPTSAPKVDCPPAPPGGSGTPSPCARGATRTSPLRP